MAEPPHKRHRRSAIDDDHRRRECDSKDRAPRDYDRDRRDDRKVRDKERNGGEERDRYGGRERDRDETVKESRRERERENGLSEGRSRKHSNKPERESEREPEPDRERDRKRDRRGRGADDQDRDRYQDKDIKRDRKRPRDDEEQRRSRSPRRDRANDRDVRDLAPTGPAKKERDLETTPVIRSRNSSPPLPAQAILQNNNRPSGFDITKPKTHRHEGRNARSVSASVEPDAMEIEPSKKSRKTRKMEKAAKAQEDYDEDDGIVVEDDGMEAMQAMLGFGGFGTTHQKKVAGNDVSGVRKEKRTEYRQYMNRVGGFNRALSPSGDDK